MKVYFISGLAGDSRVFMHIKLPEGFEKVFLDWIPPLKKETLAAYASRLAEKINTHENFALVGLSMGGMIATEIAKLHPTASTILVSSIATSKQLPFRYKVVNALKLHKIMPVSVLKNATIIKRYFTLETEADKQILRQVIHDSDPKFIRWAMGAILQWNNTNIPKSITQIHGSNDEIIPVKFTNPTHIIAKGTHMMVMTKSLEINLLLGSILSSLNTLQKDLHTD